ncbi:erythroblast NAD(P)(+)--arginine ADP-ribosyltransferase-like [Plectropomus leopardus]|uniref:erythroblast NAD(P)(+)--arginine ADP-ribosyltransferase-like n=1 Tax=Plectropomus leopardus TaxID=160734 RepID=UPI001C4C0980|nr:erythroblast NAD(P)(+)--arginine ADP-ribosyltransferase-like [Plectropomus leopardus]
MRGIVLICAPLCLLLCWMLPVGSKKISFIINLPKRNSDIQMSMAEDAVDDMYFGCSKRMAQKVKDNYFKDESKGIFEKVWKASEKCAYHNLQHRNKGDEGLTKDHMQAICAYTSGYLRFHAMFNDAVQTNRTDYGTSFPFHSLQFWLTSAIKILSKNKDCHITYRRTNAVYAGDVNQIIRFGFFASSSYKSDLTHFGKKTCFKIKTCSGASLKNYPYLKDHEQEVIIPPYEKFRITKKIENKSARDLRDCEVVYNLENAGLQSNLDCHAAY